MKRTGPNIEFASLVRTVREVEDRFVVSHLGPSKLGAPSRAEILDVAAYVVLVHGALENFVEGLASWLLARSVANWVTHKRTTPCTASLLLYQKAPDDDGSISSVFDNIRLSLDSAKDRVSKEIRENNGVAPKHLRALFLPLGVSVPTDPILIGSLDLLVKLRHQWAHQYRHGAQVMKSARDVQTTVSDCIALAKKLSAEAAALKP
jgi:hypothetical protein